MLGLCLPRFFPCVLILDVDRLLPSPEVIELVEEDVELVEHKSASPLGTSRLRGWVMKANVNYNLQGDEEPGI